MQKWHIHSAIGRARPVSCKPRGPVVSSRRSLHTTSPRAQEVLKDKIAEGQSPRPNRAKRLQEAASSIENLYLRSTAHDNSTYKPTVLASRHIGAPLSRDLLDGKTEAQSSGSERYTMGRRQQLGTPVGREVNQSAVDARSLGARPAQGSSLIRKVLRDDFNERQGPSERSIFQLRNLQGGNGVQRPHNDPNIFQQPSLREVNSFQQHPPRDESARHTSVQGAGTASQTHPTRFQKDQSSFQNRSSRGEGRAQQAGRSRPGRPRASRDNDDSEPRRRKRGVERDSGDRTRSGPKQEKWTKEEQQYLKEKEERKAPKALEFEPAEFSRETFAGMGPATASDEWGMSEMLEERLLLARNYLDGEFIQWDSKEQKADVMAVAEKLKAARRGRKPSGNGDEQAQALMQKLLAGEYAKFKRPGEKDVLGLVELHVHRNDSFYPDDEKSLLEKVRSIMPAQQASKVGRDARNKVKA